MEKTLDMVMNVKRAIADNPEMYAVVEKISFELYKNGVVRTADGINDAWTNAILTIIYNENPQAREIVNQEVWEAVNA